jgi:phosphopantetheine adenylyltransferase
MTELTDKEAQAIFNQTSKALREDDGAKLSELMEQKPLEEEAPIVTDPPEEDKTAETKVEDEQPEEKDDKDVVNDPPAVEADAVDDEDKDKDKAPSELDLLKEQLAKVSKENHALKSQAGRVPHVQRRIQELDKKLAELSKGTPPSSQASAKITPKVLEKLKGIRETDAELADTIAEVIGLTADGIADDVRTQEVENLTALRKQEYQQYQEHEAARLLEMYPNAPEVFGSPSWAEWKKEQSHQIVALAESDSADDVSFVFEKYARDMVAKYPELAKVEDKEADKTVVVSDEEREKARKIEEARSRKKETSVTVGSPTATGKVGLPEDPLALFKKFSEDIRKERTG